MDNTDSWLTVLFIVNQVRMDGVLTWDVSFLVLIKSNYWSRITFIDVLRDHWLKEMKDSFLFLYMLIDQNRFGLAIWFKNI